MVFVSNPSGPRAKARATLGPILDPVMPMYLPQAFARTDVRELHAFLDRYPFGTLIVPGTPPEVSHIPFVVDRARGGARGALVGHVARANPIWRAFDGQRSVLTVFHGPHGYVSPAWYTSRDEVPTWNYAVVHVHGSPRLLETPVDVRTALDGLVAANEQGRADRWSIEELSPQKYSELSQAIVAFEIPIDRLEGKFKLSQNRKPEDRDGAIRGLAERGSPDDLALVEIMNRTNDD
jgi:transcriptional regulator